MDATQLHKINELAREYLRLGIATSTTDAVEKAIFQLRFEKKHPAKEETPYDILFEKYKAEKKNAERMSGQTVQDTPQDSHEKKTVQTENDLMSMLTTQGAVRQSDVYLLQQEIRQLKEEWRQSLETVRREYEQLREEYSRLAEEYAALRAEIAQKRPMQQETQASDQKSDAVQPGLSQTMAERAQRHKLTIKGRPIEDTDAISVEKIFYAGKRF